VLITHDIDEALLLSDRILLLGNSPAHILGEWRIDLPPRAELVEELGALRIDILKTLRRASRNPLLNLCPLRRRLTMCLDDFTHTRRDFLKLSALLTAGGALPLLSSLQARAAAEPNAPVRIGYLPITDATPLLVAHNNGLFEAEGIRPSARCCCAVGRR
jgi:hypothetical protein